MVHATNVLFFAVMQCWGLPTVRQFTPLRRLVRQQQQTPTTAVTRASWRTAAAAVAAWQAAEVVWLTWQKAWLQWQTA